MGLFLEEWGGRRSAEVGTRGAVCVGDEGWGVEAGVGEGDGGGGEGAVAQVEEEAGGGGALGAVGEAGGG